MSTRALLFTDVVDSTEVSHVLGDSKAAELWAEHDRFGRERLIAENGTEIDRTDGFFLLFADVSNAARYALAYQEHLAKLSLRARAGLHVGEVTLRNISSEFVERGAKRFEVEGVAKPVAARIMALAGPGQILLSRAAKDALKGDLPCGSRVESHGFYRLKGVPEPFEIYELGTSGRATFLPPPDVEKAYRVVSSGELWRPVREVPHNIPFERNSFVGRTRELTRLASCFASGSRLITVVGVAGAGKTRLAQRYAMAWLGDWTGGVYFCDLSEARSLDSTYSAVARSLDVELTQADPDVQLSHAIASRARCLVILDNFEQIAVHAPTTVGRWLDRAAEAAFLVTSRERLGIGGEELLSLEPLPVEKEAIEMFVARARTQRPGIELSASDRLAIAEAVRLLDGLPLAIELAAARLRVVSPARLVRMLSDRFRLLTGMTHAPAHQATLSAAIGWSWDLLTPWEQAAFAQCSVFEGSFTLDAAESVIDLSLWPEAPPTIDVVQTLVDKSLLRAMEPYARGGSDSELCFGMYVSIHEYAATKLRRGGVDAALPAEARHGRYFAGFGTVEFVEHRRGQATRWQQQAGVLNLDNILAASRRAVARGDAEISVLAYRGAWEALHLRGPISVAVELGRDVLSMSDLGSFEPAARHVFGFALERLGDPIEAVLQQTIAMDLARAAGDIYVELAARLRLVACRRSIGQGAHLKPELESVMLRARALGFRRLEASSLHLLGAFGRDEGSLQEASDALEAALAIARDNGDLASQSRILTSAAGLASHRGMLLEAMAKHREAREIAREFGDRMGEATALTNLGVVLRDCGNIDEAKFCLEDVLRITSVAGSRRLEIWNLSQLADCHTRLGEFERARKLLDRAADLSANFKEALYALETFRLRSELNRRTGALTEALLDAQRALAISRESTSHPHEGRCLVTLAKVLADLGRVQEAAESADTAEALHRQAGDLAALGTTLCVSGLIHAQLRDGEYARKKLGEAEGVCRRMHAGPNSEWSMGVASLRAALGMQGADLNEIKEISC